jgi:photosystem II stability/assembly factor-like uncharacterized protein
MNGGLGGICGMILSSVDNGSHWTREYHECNCPSNFSADCHDCTNDPSYNPIQGQLAHTYRLQYYRTIYGVSIFAGDNSAIASGYNGQHLYRYFTSDNKWIWRDRSSFAHDFIDATTSVVFPLQGASADPAGVSATGKGLIVGEGGHIRRTIFGGHEGPNQEPAWTDSIMGSPFRIKDVYFSDATHGWQVGQFFRRAKTSDGGTSWTPSFLPASQLGTSDLLAITFAADAQHGVCVGQYDGRSAPDTNFPNKPKILWTADNDASGWAEPTGVRDYPDTTSDFTQLRAVAWAGGSTFWTAGQNGLIYSTTDYGDHWTGFRPAGESFSTFRDRQFQGVSFHDTSLGVFVGTANATSPHGVVYQYLNGAWSDLTPAADPNYVITDLTGIDATGSVAYAVGVKTLPSGARQGLILSATLSGGSFSGFSVVSNLPVIPACTAGTDLGRIAVLNRVKVSPSGDVWAGGECGRVWRLSGGTWSEQKSQTDAHVLGISLPTASVGYFGCHRQSDTQQSIVTFPP